MFSIFNSMAPPSMPAPPAVMTRASSPAESISSDATIEDLGFLDQSSTPPTSVGDSVSVSSASSLKVAAPPAIATTPSDDTSGRRSIRSRASVATYNVKVLTGTAIHAPKKYMRVSDLKLAESTRRRTISGDTLVGSRKSSTTSLKKHAKRNVSEGIAALDLQWSVKKTTKRKSLIGQKKSPKRAVMDSPKKIIESAEMDGRKSLRSSGEVTESLTKRLTVLGKRKLDAGLTRAEKELRRLADTVEFAKIDTEPVVHEVWSNGKLVVPEPANKRKKVAPVEEKQEDSKAEKEKEKAAAKKGKIWLNKGLYAGQEVVRDWFGDSSYTVKQRQEMHEVAPFKPTGILPLPMWHGQRLLHGGRDFRLPFDVCSPLPPGQPKPDEWRKTSSNRFIGEAGALWKKSPVFDSYSSKCVCTSEGGCDVDCFNRIMFYECEDTNCGAGRGSCTNRAFADLQERRKAGGKYRIGVEVIKTADRGYGVRSNRCFEANQIIVEYTGEIITEDECDRRMNEDYKDNDCYYLMSFDQNMIIDATKGSIARFVNHSCSPNSRMVKWIVGGKPRMALFAGDNPIMSGDELTYDYNFDPFSAKNVQECRCGSENCRGVLGPKPKPVKEIIKETVKATVKAGKRKLKELLGNEEDSNTGSPKKRKMKEATGAKRSASSASKRVAKAVKKSISAQVLNLRQAVSSRRGGLATPRKKGAGVRKRRGSTSSSVSIGSPAIVKAKRPYTKRGSVAKHVVRTWAREELLAA